MNTEYYKNYSSQLGRDMEIKVYGHAGRPVLFIPCQDGRFFDFENFGMTGTFGPFIDRGECMVFAIDTLDKETWSDAGGDPYYRIRRHEQWINYITRDAVPFIRQIANERNGWEGFPGIITFGCSLGATHALNLFLRFPDLFDGCLALSGIYSSSFYMGSYTDEVVYRNSPEDYLGGMPNDHPFIGRYNRNRVIVCVGQGAWEIPDSTRNLERICRDKGINIWFDYWGFDVNHDWPWWHKQAAYFLPYLLGLEEK